ncbi:energy transducer TonB [Chitinimonas lacunae]|uniref:Energy transducer TonB n=1 Tax=Chitinimonas lacunae TaxID=1963018 RepID=A0ABV8MQZ8_9NEIS
MSLTLDRNDRLFSMTVTASLIAHLLVILLVKFGPPDPRTLFNDAPLEIVLVNARAKNAPTQADVLAQQNLDGGGNTDQKLRAKSPFPPEVVDEPTDQMIQEAAQRQAVLEAQQQKLFSQLQNAPRLTPDEQRPQPSEAEKGLNIDAPPRKASEIARLEAEISRNYQAYQEQPRKAYVGARARGVVEARYVEDWRTRIERVGDLHFPKDSRGQKLYGNLRVDVEIARDGSLVSVTVARSSGNPTLDEAARRIVRMSAPFPPLPKGIVDKSGQPADILSITRTWTFTRNDNTLE